MKKYKILSIALLIAMHFFLIGCTNRADRPFNPESQAPDEVQSLLDYYYLIRSLPPENLTYLYRQEERAFRTETNYLTALRLSLLLTLQETNFYDDIRARALLNEHVVNSQYISHRTKIFTLLLADSIEKIHKNKNLYEAEISDLKGANRERDLYKKKSTELEKEIQLLSENVVQQKDYAQALEDALTKEKTVVEELKAKLEQIKTIEESINKRMGRQGPET